MAKKRYYDNQVVEAIDYGPRNTVEYIDYGPRRRYYANEGDYTDYSNRRVEEKRDFNMISEDHNAVANLPQQVIQKEWPKGGWYTPENQDDTIRGVNEQMNRDGAGVKKNWKPRKA